MLDAEMLNKKIDALNVPKGTLSALLKCSNGTLADWLSSRRPMPTDKARELHELLDRLSEMAETVKPLSLDLRDAALVGSWISLWRAKQLRAQVEVSKD